MPRNVKQILNSLAEKKRDAYVDYFIHYIIGKNENTAAFGFTDADDLYDYFLTDMKTGSEFETSYLSDALASIQQYVSNILNQKELGYSGEFSQDVQQFWMGCLGHISLWKAYQKIEDYPEDYNLPGYRNYKTKLYNDFESDLGNDSLNDAGIQTAFLKYLRGYEAVNAISVISGYIDYQSERNDNDTINRYGFLNADYFFVGKNNSAPTGFYWREANIQIDKSSDYVSPLVWHEWQPLSITEDENDILQMRIIKISGCLFVVYLVGKEEEFTEKEKEEINKEENENVNKITNEKKYKVTLKLSRMGLDKEWDVSKKLFEKIYKVKPKAKIKDKPNEFNLISVAFSQDEQKDDYLVIALLDNTKECVFSDVLNVLRQKSAADSNDMLGTDWEKKLATRFFKDKSNVCQHRIFGTEKDISVIERKDMDPNLSVKAYFSLRDNKNQLRIQGVCHRSQKTPNLASLNLQAMVKKWENGRIIISGDKNNLTIRAEATSQPEYADIYFTDNKIRVIFKKDQFKGESGWFVAEEKISLTQELCDAIAVKDYKEIRSGAGFSYKTSASDNIEVEKLASFKNRVNTVMQPVVAPAELKSLKESEIEGWNGELSYQKGSHTPWRTYSWSDDEAKEKDGENINFKFRLTNEKYKGEFTVKINNLPAGIPTIETKSGHQQFLLFNQPGSKLEHIRLNSVQVRDLIYRVQLGTERIFDWDAQITEEPAFEDNKTAILDLNGANSRYLWELFFYLPYLVASCFSQSRLYSDARKWLHYIFSPYSGHRTILTDGSESLPPPYWNCRVLTQKDLKQDNNNNALPDPHAISEDAPSHYRKSVYLMYIDTLIAEADLNYRQLTRDSITRAWGFYHQAQGMLGHIPKEYSLPKWQPCTVSELMKNETYSVQESSFPELFSEINPENIPKQLSGFFWYGSLGNERFRLPVQESLLNRQSFLEHRLFNLRHYLDIEGNLMKLPLYAAALDPFDLLRARLGGTSELTYLQSGSLTVPSYCFRAMLEKAKEQAAALITLGDKRLGYYEQKERYHTEGLQLQDAIDLADASADIQSFLLKQQKSTLKSLEMTLEMTTKRHIYYTDLFDNGISTKEADARNLQVASSVVQGVVTGAAVAAGIAAAIPRVFGLAQDTGDHGKTALLAGVGGIAAFSADIMRGTADCMQLDEQYRRRQEEWGFAADQAKNEIAVLNEQIKAQEAAITAAENSVRYTQLVKTQAKNLYNYFSQSRQVNESLYGKMVNILGLLHDQLCSLVRTFCALTEASWRYETDDYKHRTFIPGDLWNGDNLGVLVGIKLQKALLEMEIAYTQQNTRLLNITKTISLKSLISKNLIKADNSVLETWDAVKTALKSEKKLSFEFSHAFFDDDFSGHYARKIHSLSLTFPTLLAPYQNMRVLLEQTANTLLISPDIDAVKSLYEPSENTSSEFIIRNLRINQKIILSRGSDDSGEFPEDIFTSGQYHNFQQTGAVSQWQLSVPRPIKASELIDNLNDVIIKMNYTAKSGSDEFAKAVNDLLENNDAEKQD